MKKILLSILIALSCFSFFAISSCIIKDPKPEGCEIVTAKIVRISEGSTYDIVFHDDGTDFYYINRGLQQGLNIDSLNDKVLNKTVTLHLAKVFGGITSEHISQLAIGDDIIYTEFN